MSSNVRYDVVVMLGTPTLVAGEVYTASFLAQAWDELPELQANPRGDYIREVIGYLKRTPRVEINAVVDGRIVGVLYFNIGPDFHTLDTAYTLFHYILPEYRGRVSSLRMAKLYMRMARGAKCRTAVWSKRTAEGVYVHTYRRL